MLQAGRMTERIELLSRTAQRNAHGQTLNEWITLGTLRAQLVSNSSTVSHSEKRDNTIRTVVLFVRKDNRLSEGLTVRYQSSVGHIVAMEYLRHSKAYQINIEFEQ